MFLGPVAGMSGPSPEQLEAQAKALEWLVEHKISAYTSARQQQHKGGRCLAFTPLGVAGGGGRRRASRATGDGAKRSSSVLAKLAALALGLAALGFSSSVLGVDSVPGHGG